MQFGTATKSIVISFDYDHDKNYRYLLSALKTNKSSAIELSNPSGATSPKTNIARFLSMPSIRETLSFRRLWMNGSGSASCPRISITKHSPRQIALLSGHWKESIRNTSRCRWHPPGVTAS